jgi:Fe-Mn family superoxide dismutase
MKTSRKDFIKTGALVVAGSMVNTSLLQAAVQKIQQAGSTFILPKLNYAYNALEPFIDATTMEIHHSKHHQAYVNKLNEAINKEPSLAGKTLEELISKTQQLPESVKSTVRNNAGGHWNHSFFWELLKTGTKPSDRVVATISKQFGSMDEFKKQLEKAGLGQFGSGWAWLVKQGDKLVITATPNQDNPLMDVATVKGTPIIGIDVWEHAYYLKYQNKRADYLQAFWNVLNWEKVDVLLHA